MRVARTQNDEAAGLGRGERKQRKKGARAEGGRGGGGQQLPWRAQSREAEVRARLVTAERRGRRWERKRKGYSKGQAERASAKKKNIEGKDRRDEV